MWTIIINLISIIILGVIIYLLIPIIKLKRIKYKIVNSRAYIKLSEYLFVIIKRNLISQKISKIRPLVIIFIMFITSSITFTIFYSYLKVATTAVILSIPFFLSPIIIIKILLNKEKGQITKNLPMYVINIKNHIAADNNIISAIQKTYVDQPLKKYIDVFKTNISHGMNVIEAFDLLKLEVNVKAFNSFINCCEVCYLNGGNFNKVLDKYVDLLTKENIHRESTKEKAYTDILTLIIMVILNVLVIIIFVFANKDYAEIIRQNFLGRLILNINAISCILIAYLISRIYKEE